MTDELVLTNARIVLAERVIDGHVVIRDGMISEIGDGAARSSEDMGGDYLLPGLVELHTDHLESHYLPRPQVRWNKMASIQAHDAQVSASGITTVFDALRVGSDENAGITGPDMREMADTIASAVHSGRLRADHYIHLRCEVSASDVIEGFESIQNNERLRLASLMDHAPGQRQFTSFDTYRTYYQRKMKLSDSEFEMFCERRMLQSSENSPRNRPVIAERCRDEGIVLASHDDATNEHVSEALALGTALAEFPTTIEAARASATSGLKVLMGAPNVVRGGSHSGNISALDLYREGTLDVLSSDYVPFSLLQSAFVLADSGEAGLADAVRLISKHPAEVAGLADRGEIAPAKRADLVRVKAEAGMPPIVRAVWRCGERVA